MQSQSPTPPGRHGSRHGQAADKEGWEGEAGKEGEEERHAMLVGGGEVEGGGGGGGVVGRRGREKGSKLASPSPLPGNHQSFSAR